MLVSDLLIIINRIEANIEQQLDFNQLCEGLGMTASTLQRIFPVLFNITLTDYIRKRRLSKAALDLKQTEDSILEISLKYNYTTPEAFTAAFKKQHGATPSAVRKGTSFNFFKPIELNLSYTGADDLPIEIVTKPDFYVAGISIDTTVNNTDIPLLWDQLSRSDFIDELIKVSTGKSFGVCYDVNKDGHIKYMAGWGIDNPDVVKRLPVEVTLIESSTFAIIPCVGEFPQSLHNAWDYLWRKFFPESGYTYAGSADLEYYPSKVTDSKDYRMEIWVPIEKRNKNRM